jgi:hypothetical protein
VLINLNKCTFLKEELVYVLRYVLDILVYVLKHILESLWYMARGISW